MSFVKFPLILVMIHSNAWALEPVVLIRAEPADVASFKSYVASEVRFQAFSEWWVRHRVKPEHQAKLQRLLELAQVEFLQGSITEAHDNFVQLSDLRHQADWQVSERKALAYAELRLAQLAAEGPDRQNHLKKAAALGDVRLQAALFPKPLWQNYLSLLKVRPSLEASQDIARFPDARYLVIDGKPYTLDENDLPPVDSETHRFTLVFDHASPVSIVGEWAEFKNWRVSPKPFAMGDCRQLEIQGQSELPLSAKIYFNDQCVSDVRLNAATPNSAPVLEPSATGPASLTFPTVPQAKRAVPNWLWATVGAALLGSLIWMGQDQKRSTKPSTSVGF